MKSINAPFVLQLRIVFFFGIDQEKTQQKQQQQQRPARIGRVWEGGKVLSDDCNVDWEETKTTLKWIVRQLDARCLWVGLLQSAYFNTCISQCWERTLAPSSTMNTKDQQTNISDKTWESLSRYHVIRFCRQHCYYYIAISRNICCIHFSAFSQCAAQLLLPMLMLLLHLGLRNYTEPNKIT